jgi:indolepyruvate ferredoxin oxidoreductase alpha subunit
LGNAPPLDMVDTCLCMGAGITVAQGLHRIEPDRLHFAFIGDSTFFHSGIPGIVNAVYNQSDLIVVILDNGTTAMTGGQPHPGNGKTMMGRTSVAIDIPGVLSALRVSKIARANPFDLGAARAAVRSVMDIRGVRVVLFEAPCIALVKGGPGSSCAVDEAQCSGCGLCLSKLGCPAMHMESGKAKINPALCTGCDVCSQLCARGAIGRVAIGGETL